MMFFSVKTKKWKLSYLDEKIKERERRRLMMMLLVWDFFVNALHLEK